MPQYHYALYGATIRSNRLLPGMAVARESGRIIDVSFDGLSIDDPPRATHVRTSGIESVWQCGDGSWIVRYDALGPGRFWTMHFAASGDRVSVRWSVDALLFDIPAVVQGVGIAGALHLQDRPLLHAAALTAREGTILVMGAAGAGKSTTAAALLARGCRLVSDDIAALDLDGPVAHVHAGYPRLRLYADAASAAGWDGGSLPRLFVSPALDDKRFIAVSEAEGTFSADALPLRAIYVLRQRVPGARLAITTLTSREALPRLRRQMFLDGYFDRPDGDRALAVCARLAAEVPVRLVQAPDDLAALPALADALIGNAIQVAPPR